jgi:hypothetical protein
MLGFKSITCRSNTQAATHYNITYVTPRQIKESLDRWYIGSRQAGGVDLGYLRCCCLNIWTDWGYYRFLSSAKYLEPSNSMWGPAAIGNVCNDLHTVCDNKERLWTFIRRRCRATTMYSSRQRSLPLEGAQNFVQTRQSPAQEVGHDDSWPKAATPPPPPNTTAGREVTGANLNAKPWARRRVGQAYTTEAENIMHVTRHQHPVVLL